MDVFPRQSFFYCKYYHEYKPQDFQDVYNPIIYFFNMFHPYTEISIHVL